MKVKVFRKRTNARRRASLGATVRDAAGRPQPVELTEISERGCRVRLGQRVQLADEQRVVVRPGTLEGLPAVVRWSRGEAAGIEFSDALYPPVVDHLVRTGAALPADLAMVADETPEPPARRRTRPKRSC